MQAQSQEDVTPKTRTHADRTDIFLGETTEKKWMQQEREHGLAC